MDRIKPKLLLENEENKSSKTKINKMQKDLFGSISAEQLPIDFQMESVRLELQIPKREWDGYSCAEKGKIMAVQIIQNRIELIKRVHQYLEDNKKSAIKDIKKS
jgi:hypothetical protein